MNTNKHELFLIEEVFQIVEYTMDMLKTPRTKNISVHLSLSVVEAISANQCPPVVKYKGK